MNNDRFSGLLGICRKAGKMSVGHDESKASIKSKKAFACILACDSSQRLKDEFSTMCSQNGVPLITVNQSIEQFAFIIGSAAAVITVNDEGFAERLMTYREVNI